MRKEKGNNEEGGGDGVGGDGVICEVVGVVEEAMEAKGFGRDERRTEVV